LIECVYCIIFAKISRKTVTVIVIYIALVCERSIARADVKTSIVIAIAR